MKEDDYIPDIERQDQIAIDERKKEREERRELYSPSSELVFSIHFDKQYNCLECCDTGFVIPSGFICGFCKKFSDDYWKKEEKTVREFIDANCKPKR